MNSVFFRGFHHKQNNCLLILSPQFGWVIGCDTMSIHGTWWHKMCFKRVSLHKIGCFLLLLWTISIRTGWIGEVRLGFSFRCKMTGRAKAKKDYLYIFQIYCFLPVDFCPSKPLHYQVIRQMEAKNRFIRLFTGINCPLSAISPCQTIVLRDPFIARW